MVSIYFEVSTNLGYLDIHRFAVGSIGDGSDFPLAAEKTFKMSLLPERRLMFLLVVVVLVLVLPAPLGARSATWASTSPATGQTIWPPRCHSGSHLCLRSRPYRGWRKRAQGDACVERKTGYAGAKARRINHIHTCIPPRLFGANSSVLDNFNDGLYA